MTLKYTTISQVIERLEEDKTYLTNQIAESQARIILDAKLLNLHLLETQVSDLRAAVSKRKYCEILLTLIQTDD